MRADHPAGTGVDSDPFMAGVDAGYPRLEVGAVGVASWEQQRWITYELSPAVAGGAGFSFERR